MDAGLVSRARRRPFERFSSVLVVVTLAMAGAIGLTAAAAGPALASVCTNTAPITLGDPAVTGSITDGTQVDCYTFDGIVGDRVHIAVNATSGTLAPSTAVLDPSDATVCGPTTDAEQVCQLATSGTHTIVIQDSTNTETGDYTVSADSLHAACTNTNPITLGDPATNGSITTEGQADCYTFSGATGDKVHITVVGVSGTLVPNTSVIDPSDAVVCGPTTDSEQTCELAADGTHTIEIRDSAATNTGDYTVAADLVPPPPPPCTPLTLGAAALAGSIDTAGQTDCYTFSGNLGDHVVVSAAATDGLLETQTTVLDPSSAPLCGPTTAADLSCHLTSTGEYTITIADSAGVNTGGYTVSAAIVPATCADTVPIQLGITLPGTISGEDDAHCYTFTAKKNDRMFVRVVETDGGTLDASTTVFNAGNAAVCGPTTDTEQTCSIPADGLYTIMVKDLIGTNTGTYAIYMQRLDIPKRCTELVFGDAAITGSISVPGDAACFTFRAPTGKRLRLRVVETGGSLAASTQVFNTKGTTLCGPTTDTEITCKIATGRNHTIIVRDLAGPNTGTFSIYAQLSRPVSCTALRIGKLQTGAITVPGNADCYTFSGTSGDRIRMRAVTTDGGTFVPYTDIINPNGTTACGPSAATEQTCRLTATGTSTVMIRDADGPNTGTYSLYVQTLNAPLRCTAINIGDPPLAAAITAPGDAQCFTFTGIGGTKMRFDVVGIDGTLVPNTEILNANGTTLCGPSTAATQSCRLTSSGTITVFVRDNAGTGTGNYTVAASNV